ncbi:MAG: hypothetical protein CSB44_02315 [Gammaproteobacteria bacterium]|nr:MAG: hypothetical protein CSB44_02315 [Gammaproteobacteria bacterium]
MMQLADNCAFGASGSFPGATSNRAGDMAADTAGRVPWRPLASIVAVVLGVLLVFEVRDYVIDPQHFPVQNVDVLGTLDYADRGNIQSVIVPFVSLGFYGLDIDAVRDAVEATPWVASAHVSRVWPGRITVEVDEHEPMARWNDNAFISKRLDVFEPSQLDMNNPGYDEWRQMFSDLPQLYGGDGRHDVVVDDYRRYSGALAPIGLAIVVLEEDERQSQTLRLSNGVSLELGYENQEQRLARFVDVAPRLFDGLDAATARRTGIDMRYSNGFTVSGARPGERLGVNEQGKSGQSAGQSGEHSEEAR